MVLLRTFIWISFGIHECFKTEIQTLGLKASHKTSTSCVFFFTPKISDSLIQIEVGNNWCMKRAGSTDVKRTGKEDRQITGTRGSHPPSGSL